MQFATLAFALASACAAYAQTSVPFGNSSSSSIVSSAAPSASSLPSGVVTTFNIFTADGTGVLLCINGIVEVNPYTPTEPISTSSGYSYAGPVMSSKSTFTLYRNGSLSCLGDLVYGAQNNVNTKRQASSPIYGISYQEPTPDGTQNLITLVGYFNRIFSVSGTQFSLTVDGAPFSFGKVTQAPLNVQRLVAFDPAMGTPASVTPISLVISQVSGPVTSSSMMPSSITTSPTGSNMTSVGPTSTVTSTVTEIVNGVSVTVVIVVIIIPLASPRVVTQVIYVIINGVGYYITETKTVTAITSTISSNGAVPTGQVIVYIYPIVVAATETILVSGVTTTISRLITTTGLVTSTVNGGGATVTVTAPATVTPTRPVQITATGPVATTPVGALPVSGTTLPISGPSNAAGSLSGVSTVSALLMALCFSLIVM